MSTNSSMSKTPFIFLFFFCTLFLYVSAVKLEENTLSVPKGEQKLGADKLIGWKDAKKREKRKFARRNGKKREEVKFPQPDGKKREEVKVAQPDGKKWEEGKFPQPDGKKWEEGKLPQPDGKKWEEGKLPQPDGKKWEEGKLPQPDGKKWEEGKLPQPDGKKWEEVKFPQPDGKKRKAKFGRWMGPDLKKRDTHTMVTTTHGNALEGGSKHKRSVWLRSRGWNAE